MTTTRPVEPAHLSASSFDHEFACQVLRWGGLQGLQDNRLVQGVTRDHRPVVEHREPKRLPLRVVAQVRLESEGLYHRQESLRGAR
jgi:hypothetical protein